MFIRINHNKYTITQTNTLSVAPIKSYLKSAMSNVLSNFSFPIPINKAKAAPINIPGKANIPPYAVINAEIKTCNRLE